MEDESGFVVTKKRKTEKKTKKKKKLSEREIPETVVLTKEMVEDRHSYIGDFETYADDEPQARCIEDSKRNNNLPIWAFDFEGANKKYQTRSYKSLMNEVALNWEKKKKSHWYEIILPYLYCNIFVDLDGDLTIPGNKPEAMKQLHKDFMKFFIEFLMEKKYITTRDQVTFYITDSSSPKKLSKHYVIRIENKVFKNIFHVGSLIRHFINWMIVYDDAVDNLEKCRLWIKSYKDKKNKVGVISDCAIDRAVFTNWRVFRGPYNQKLTGGEPLKPSRYVHGMRHEVEVVDHLSFMKKEDIYKYFVQYDINDKEVLTCETYSGTEPFSTNDRSFELIGTEGPAFVKLSMPRVVYMKNQFPFQEIWNRFGTPNREFMRDIANPTRDKKKLITRSRHFYNNFSEFKNSIMSTKEAVIGVHIGGVFSEQKNTSKLLRKEFIIDCDIPDWKDEEGKSFRLCGCTGSLCKDCYNVMVLTYHVITFIVSDKCLRLGPIEIYYSGSKGLHIWLNPDDVSLSSIVAPTQRVKFFDMLKFQPWIAKEMLKEENIINSLSSIKACDKLKQPNEKTDYEVLKLYWPRIDEKVFTNPCGKRMIRCPGSLHTKTNRKVERITDPTAFFKEVFGFSN